jgi:hypothetical protein
MHYESISGCSSMVEHHLAMVGVESSSLFIRSNLPSGILESNLTFLNHSTNPLEGHFDGFSAHLSVIL